MSNNRYSRIFTLKSNLYAEGMPILVKAGALLKDNDTNRVLAQLKFKNVSGNIIECIKVKITAFDAADREIPNKVEFQYLDLNARNYSEFGSNTPIYIDVVARSFDVEIMEVIFSDKSIWNNNNERLEEIVEAEWLVSKLGDEELIEQYAIETGVDCVYVPQHYKDLWICTCGEFNSIKSSSCYYCYAELETLMEKLDKEKLKKQYEERIELERQKEEEIRLAKEKAKQERIDKLNVIKEKIKNFVLFRSKKNIILTSICVVLFIGITILWKSGIVFDKFSANLYDSYKNQTISYNDAIEKINFIDKLGDVKWAQDKCNELKKSRDAYTKGTELKKQKDYINAVIEFGKVIKEDSNYNNSQTYIQELKKVAKDELLISLEEKLTRNNYIDALKSIQNIKTILPDDKKIIEYESTFNKIKEEEELKQKIAACDLSNAKGIEEYLNLKYSKLKNTPMGDWEFSFCVLDHSDSISWCEDYTIMVDFEKGPYSDLTSKYYCDYPKTDRDNTENLLKDYMEGIARDIIGKVPSKKFTGYYHGTYGDNFYMWENYEWGASSNKNNTQASTFRWSQFAENFFDEYLTPWD